jgi:DNA-binding IclR family transcriptional regulator
VGQDSRVEHSGIGVIDKAAAILSATSVAPLSLAELVETTGIPRATAHRLAMALYAHRLLGRDADGRFLPGGRLAELAASVPDPLLIAAAPVLDWVRDETGESAQLYRVDGSERLCIAVAERATGLRTTVPVGSRLPLTAGSGAQVLCAWRPEPELTAALVGAVFTGRTLAEVRRRGWAQSVGQREAGVASVSAPVCSPEGNVIAALSISGPIERLGRAPGHQAGPTLVRGAQRIAAALGPH